MERLDQIAQRSKASQNAHELASLLKEVDFIGPNIILEIGVHLGHSLITWKEAFDPYLIIGVEREGLELYEQGIELVHGDSHDQLTCNRVRRLLGEDQVDFLFIDGDHTYEGVMQDYEMYAPLVRDGGIVAFHDIMLTAPKWKGLVEVNQFWNEIKTTAPDYKEFWNEDTGGTGTGVIFT